MKLLVVVFGCVIALCRADNPCPDLERNTFYIDKTFLDTEDSAPTHDDIISQVDTRVVNTLRSSAICTTLEENVPTPCTDCHTCPVRVVYLHTFNNGNCHVFFPHRHLIRLARCSFFQCHTHLCSTKWCRPHGWAKVWFYGHCVDPYRHWLAGYTFNYLWLPQTCTCQ